MNVLLFRLLVMNVIGMESVEWYCWIVRIFRKVVFWVILVYIYFSKFSSSEKNICRVDLSIESWSVKKVVEVRFFDVIELVRIILAVVWVSCVFVYMFEDCLL